MKQGKILLSVSSKLYISMVGVLAICFAIGGKNASTLWGVPFPKGESELLIQPFFRWHLLTIPPLLFASEYLSNMQAMEVFIRIRIKNDRELTRLQINTCVIVSAFWGILVALVGFAVNPVESVVKAFLLTVMGHVMWISFYLSLYYATKTVSAALVATILSTASIYYIGALLNPKWKFLPTSWGMVSRSNIYDGCGIPVGLALKSSLLVSCGSLLVIHLVNWQRRGKL